VKESTMIAIYSSIEVLRDINRAIGAKINGYDYFKEELLNEIGYLPIHESYYDTIIGVLKEFDGEFEVKELVEVKINEDGSEELVFRNVDKSQLFTK